MNTHVTSTEPVLATSFQSNSTHQNTHTKSMTYTTKNDDAVNLSIHESTSWTKGNPNTNHLTGYANREAISDVTYSARFRAFVEAHRNESDTDQQSTIDNTQYSNMNETQSIDQYVQNKTSTLIQQRKKCFQQLFSWKQELQNSIQMHRRLLEKERNP